MVPDPGDRMDGPVGRQSRLMAVLRVSRPKNNAPFLSPTSFFNRPLGDGDTLSADQSTAGMLANAINYANQSYAHWYGYTGPGYGKANWPWSVGFNGPGTYGAPIYCVRPSDPSQNITHQTVSFYWSDSSGLHRYANLNGLETYLAAVPLPDKALCPMITGGVNYTDVWSGGTDQYCCIWNLDTDEWWDFWVLSNNKTNVQAFTGTTWNAGYGGYIPNVSKSSGVFAHSWGARACSLSMAGGVITMQDLRDVQAGGTINHALCFATGINGWGTPVRPATRGDGYSGGNSWPPAIPSSFPNAGQTNPAYQHDQLHESNRFRFPAGSTEANLAALNPYPLAREICRAIEVYGFYDVDTTGGVGVFMEDDRTVGSPYHLQGASAPHPWSLSWPGGDPRYGGQPRSSGWTVLNNLPWNLLQALTPVAS
jgi:hypothetical protein